MAKKKKKKKETFMHFDGSLFILFEKVTHGGGEMVRGKGKK